MKLLPHKAGEATHQATRGGAEEPGLHLGAEPRDGERAAAPCCTQPILGHHLGEESDKPAAVAEAIVRYLT
jgi:hypothetical protein